MKLFASRWFLILPFVLAGIILAVWYGVWRGGGTIMRAEVARIAEDHRALGATVSHAPLTLEGFPFFLRGRLDDVRYDNGAPGADNVLFEADTVFIDALPYAIDRLIFSVAGRQRISAGAMAFTIDSTDARANVASDPARGWVLRADAGALAVTATARDTAPPAIDRLTTGPVIINVTPAPDHPTVLEISLTVDTPAVSMAQLRANPDSASIPQTASGALAARQIELFAAISASDQFSAPESWRAAGGTVDLRTLSLDAGTIRLDLAGRILIDRAGYPAGTLEARIDQPQNLAAILEAIGMIDEDEARALGGGLALAAIPGGGTVRAPIILQDGEAEILGQRVAPLPRFFNDAP